MKTLLVLVSTILAILAAEMLARVLGVGGEFGRLIPLEGAPTRTVDGVVLWSDSHPRYDGQEMRRASADDGAFTIIGLGDSIMYGVGQPREATYLEHARRVLAQRSRRRVEILNLAVPGFNTMQESAVYKEIGDAVRPDLVVVHYWGDDARQYRVAGGYVLDFGDIADDGRLVVRALPLPPRLSNSLLLHSRLYNLLTHAVVAYTRRAQPNDWTRVAKPLEAIHERAQRAGGRLLVLASPDLSDASPQPSGDLVPLRRLAATRGFEVIDLSQWLQGVDARQVTMDGCHFNAEGHQLVGERLAAYLLQHDLQEPGEVALEADAP